MLFCSFAKIDWFLYRYEGPLLEEGSLLTALEGEQLTQGFMTLCVWLSDNLKVVCRLGEMLSGRCTYT